MRISSFLYFILLHILGDYYFQNEKLATDKKQKYKKVILHGLIYFIQAFIISVILLDIDSIYYVIIFSFIHLLIDSGKYLINKIILVSKEKGYSIDLKAAEIKLYITDQLFHIVSIYMFNLYLANNLNVIKKPMFLKYMASDFDLVSIFCFIIMILLILKPVNITFRIFFSHIKPNIQKESNEKEYKVGSLIGSIERIIISILLLINQYTAIGFILTAKSITRYDKISKDQEFAEYYLLGTLFSMLSAMVIYFVFFKILL
ncbi:MAG: DUF3307 domain-containing protein [Bacillota bacterium]